MAHRVIARFDESRAIVRGALRRFAVPTSCASEPPTEHAEKRTGNGGHPWSEHREKEREWDELRQCANPTEQSVPEPRFEFAHAVSECEDGATRRAHLGGLIVVSHVAQPVKSEERVEQVEAERGSHLARHTRLDVCRIRAGEALDDDDSKPHER
jgi:hypothetical protein